MLMKKKLFLTFLLALAAIGAGAQTFTQGALSYTVTDADAKTVSVAKVSNELTTGDVVVPATIENEGTTYTVTSIAADGFSGCNQMTTIALPGTLTTIGDRAFEYCDALTAFTVPASVTTYGSNVFDRSGNLWESLQNFTVADSEETLVCGNIGGGFPGYTIYLGRDITRTSGNNYAWYSTVQHVAIGPKVTTIGESAFNGCSNIEDFDFSQATSLTTIGSSAFYNCSKVTSLDLSKTKLAAVANNGFYGLTAAETITLPANTVKSIGDGAYGYCNELKAVIIPASVETIGNNPFNYNSNSWSKMETFTIEDSEETLECGNIGGGFPGHTFYLGRNLTRTSGNNYVWPNTVQHVTIGPKVTTLGEYAFSDCSNIEDFDFSQATDITTIPERCFNNCDGLREFTIPANITTIEASAFWNMNGDMNLTIADSDEPLTINATSSYYPIFEYNNITAYIGRNIVRTGGYENHSLFNTSADYKNAVTFGPKVTTIDDNLFKECRSLISVDLSGSGVTSIGEKAFNYCLNLTSVKLGDKLTTMGDYVFQDCQLLPAISLPGTLKKVPVEAFENCFALATVTLAEGIEEIANGAFYDTDALTEITIPASVKKIGRAVFYCNNTQAMKRMVIADSDTPLEFVNSTSEYTWGTGNLTDDAITLDYLYLGRDINRVDKTVSLVPDCKHIEIGPKVTALDDNLFYRTGDTSPNFVENVTVHWATPIALDEAVFHTNTYANASLWWPGGKTNPYAEADGWKNFVKQEALQYVVTLKSTTGGQLTLGETAATAEGVDVMVDRETDVTVNLTKEQDYDFTSLTVNGGSATVTDMAYTIESILANTELAATFTEKPKFTIAAQVVDGEDGIGGTATINGKASDDIYRDRDVEIVLTPNEGYELTALTDGETDVWSQVSPETGVYTLQNIQAAHTVKATFTKLHFAVSKAETVNGTITLSATDVKWGDNATATFTPATGYELKTATVNGEDKTASVADQKLTITNIKEDKTVAATFQTIVYTIAYDLDGGTVADGSPVSTYTVETETFTLVNPTRTGYDFAGWTGTGLDAATKTVTIAKGSTGNRSYKATWTPIEYTITYDLAGGTVADGSPVSTYTIESADITLPTPTREHYDFAGWTGTGLDAATMTVVIAQGSTGNRSYTATWERQTYTVSITGGNVTADNYSPKYGDDVVLTILEDEDATLTALTVNGTDVTAQVAGGKFTIQNVQGNVSVVATWNATKEFITLTGERATFSCSKAVNFTGSDVKAYVAVGYSKTDNKVLVTRVYFVPANTGVMLMGEPGTYKVPYDDLTQAYYVNLFKANVTASTVPAESGDMKNFFLKKVGDEYEFVASDGTGTLAAQRAYLQLPKDLFDGEAKIGITFDDDDTTDLSSYELLVQPKESVYDLSGRKLDRTNSKGVYIINGKKVVK